MSLLALNCIAGGSHGALGNGATPQQHVNVVELGRVWPHEKTRQRDQEMVAGWQK